MAQRIVLSDDINGETENVSTHTFAWDGQTIEIDLTEKNAEKVASFLQPYVEAGRKVSNRGAGTGSPRKASASSDRTRTQAIKMWALDNGISVNERGRLASSVIEAYEAANPGK